jgi:hypothetical protein
MTKQFLIGQFADDRGDRHTAVSEEDFAKGPTQRGEWGFHEGSVLLTCISDGVKLSVPETVQELADTAQRLNRLRKNSGPGRNGVPQGLKPDVFSPFTARLKVVP